MTEIEVTPAPQLVLYVASTWRRFGAVLIDFLFLSPFSLNLYFSLEVRDGAILFHWIPYGMVCGFALAYNILFLKFKSRTPGKMILGLFVTDAFTHEARLSWKQCILRTCSFYSLTLLVGLASQTIALFRLDRRQTADLIAGTQVMQDRERKHPPKKRWVIGSILFLFYGISGLLSISKWNQWHFTREGVSIPVGKTPVQKLQDK